MQAHKLARIHQFVKFVQGQTQAPSFAPQYSLIIHSRRRPVADAVAEREAETSGARRTVTRKKSGVVGTTTTITRLNCPDSDESANGCAESGCRKHSGVRVEGRFAQARTDGREGHVWGCGCGNICLKSRLTQSA